MGHIVGRLRGATDSLRASFFFLPAVAVLVAFPAARLAVGLEAPAWVGESTVDSARAVLSTVAAATITFASITFSISLLIMQQASNQLSPRVIHGLTRDPFNRRVIAIVMGTFTFCLVALQRVRGPLEGEGSGGEQVVPDAAVAIGLVLGIVAVLAVVAAIHHTSRQMDVSVILGRIVDESLGASTPAVVGTPVETTELPEGPPPGLEATEVRIEGSGWIRSIDRGALLALTPPGGVLRLETEVGRYAIGGSVLCRIWPALEEDEDECARLVNRAVLLGSTRTMAEDRGYGVRQIVDVALRALSPGVNDPTTAQDAIFHLGAVLVASLEADPLPSVVRGEGDRRLVAPHVSTDEEMAELAFSELRASASVQPMVALYLLEMIDSVIEGAEACGAGDRTGPLRDQARLVLRHVEQADLLDVDLGRVRAAYASRFADEGA